MRFERMEQNDQDQELRGEPGLGAPAGVFLIDGDFHVAAFRSRAFQQMRAMGALLIAALHFNADDAALATDGGRRMEGAPRLG